MQKKMNKLVPAMLIAAACSATSAQVVDFVFPASGATGLTTDTFTDPTTGLSLTIDNPRDNVIFGDNTFGYTLGGLFIDGGFAPTVDWTFSEAVRLVEYELGNQDNLDLFTLTQGTAVSADNTTIPVSTFPFTETTRTFAGGAPIALTTSNHDGGGYSFARVRVEIVQPAPAYAVDGFGGTDLYRIDLAQGTETLVGNVGQTVLGMTFDASGSRLFGYTNSGDLLRINPATGSTVTVGNSGLVGEFGFGLAFHNGRLYGASEASENFYEINPNTGSVNLIGNLGQSVAGLASIGTRLYGIADTPDNNLVLINTATGVAATVGPLGFSGSYLGASADSSGRMWGVNSNGETYRINLGTGAGTQIADLANGYTAMAINAGPSLIGDDYIADLYINNSLFTSNNDTALVGPDADGTWSNAASLPYDLEANTINVESSFSSGSWTTGIQFEFRDLDFDVPGQKIVGVNILRATGNGWDQIDLSDISFTGNSVFIDASEIAGIVPALDQGITVRVIPGPAVNFIGDDYIANYYYNAALRQTRNDTALVGPDAIGNFEGHTTYDIEPDNTLSINCVFAGGTWQPGQMWEFLDLELNDPSQVITGATVISATGAGWSNIDDSDLSFTADSLLIDAVDIVGITTALNQSVKIRFITGPAGPACPGDIADDFGNPGGDGMVSFGDFLALLGLIGPCPGGTPGCVGDIADDFGNPGGDGMVSFGDFLALLGLIGPCP